MLDVVVPSVVAQILHGDSRAQEVRKPKRLLDKLLGLGSIISTVDDVEVMCGKQIQFSDKLLGLNGGEIRSREADIVRGFCGRERDERKESE